MNNKIVKVLEYFLFFAYYPTSDEIYTFLETKISKNSLNIKLKKMVGLKEIQGYSVNNIKRYTVGEYGINKIKDQKSKIKNSEKKLNNWRFRAYKRLIYLFPQIKLVGLSGSVSMMNANKNDDIDLFIITANNRLFTGRLISLFLAQILGLRRTRGSNQEISKNKICLNLFFDERDLMVPKFKRTRFVGHEVLQMKPIINKQGTYERFLASNKWVFELFPNAKQIFNFQFSIFNEKFKIKNDKLGDWIESQLKRFQLNIINRHRTSEIITSSQLWFHPDDFEKKLS